MAQGRVSASLPGRELRLDGCFHIFYGGHFHWPEATNFRCRAKAAAPLWVQVLFWVVWLPIGGPLFVVRLLILVVALAFILVLPQSCCSRTISRPCASWLLFPLLGLVPLFARVTPDECSWTLDKGEVVVSLEKGEARPWTELVLPGH